MLGELQWTLIGVVLLIFAAVLIYNRWQERRARQSVSELFNPRHPASRNAATEAESLDAVVADDADSTLEAQAGVDDADARHQSHYTPPVLPDAVFSEGSSEPQRVDDDIPPPWQGVAEAAAPGVGRQMSLVDDLDRFSDEIPRAALPSDLTRAAPATASVPTSEMAPGTTPDTAATASTQSPLRADLEYVIRMPFLITADRGLAELMDRLRSSQRPARIFGQRSEGGWEPVAHYSAVQYEAVEIGILLANRKGPTRQDDLQAACSACERFALEHGGAADCPDVALLTVQAIELDRFCAEVDQLIDFAVVVPPGLPFSGEALARIVSEQGMQRLVNGSFVMYDAVGEIEFTLVNKEDMPFPDGGHGVRTHGVGLLLEVPRCAHGLEAFDRMVALGRLLADKLSGRLVDNQERPIDLPRLTQDREQLREVYRRMHAYGIVPGSEAAQRLFA